MGLKISLGNFMQFVSPFGPVITALASPFYKGKLDRDSFIKLLEWQKKNQIKTWVLNGTTGESPNLQVKEVETLFSITKERSSSKIKIILGVGGNSTFKVKQNIEYLGRLKPDAILSVVPYYNLPSQQGLRGHFLNIADASSIPIILYNVPSRTGGRGLSLDSIKQLSLHPNIIGIKEASGSLLFAQKIMMETKNFLFLSGDDNSFLNTMALGGDGVISVLSNIIGKKLIDLSKKVLKAPAQTLELFNKDYKELIENIYSEVNPRGIKMALYLMKIFKSPTMRLPLVEMSPPNKKKLGKTLKKLRLIK